MDLNIGAMPLLSSAIVQNDLLTQVGTSILNTTLDTTAESVAKLTKAMELSVNPNLGANFDMSV